MKESARLITMNQIIGSVKVDNDLFGSFVVCTQKRIDIKLIDQMTIYSNLFVSAFAVGTYGGKFKAIECAFTSQCLAFVTLSATVLAGGVIFTCKYRKQRIVA